MEEFSEIIRSIAQRLISDYSESGHVKTGVNGPYDDPETEVRNLSHLLIIIAVEYLTFAKKENYDLIVEIADKLITMKSSNGVYIMRQKEGKDRCNGVIGHAWLMEGLIYAYKVTSNDAYLEECNRICVMHEFNDSIGLWGRPLMGNDDTAIDYTFNHELWFAASLAELLKVRPDTLLQQQLDRFMERLTNNLTVNSNGRIAHCIYNRVSLANKAKQSVKRMLELIAERQGEPNLRYKEEGYHVFNLMAFARIYNINPDYIFFKTKKFQKALDYIGTAMLSDGLKSGNIKSDRTLQKHSLTEEEQSINIYGYPYNVPGFELMYCDAVFGKRMTAGAASKIMAEQMAMTWDTTTGMLGKACHDKVVVNYRAYEYYRYFEII